MQGCLKKTIEILDALTAFQYYAVLFWRDSRAVKGGRL